MATQQQININTAPLEVIAALSDNIDDAMAERIVAERRVNPFKKTANISRIPGGAAISSELTAILIYRGTVFKITSIARVKDSARTVEAVVRLSDEKKMSWQEY
jgi:type II secretory pathway component PulK